MSDLMHPELSTMCSICWKHAKNSTCIDGSCCLAGLYDKNPSPTVDNIIQYCCINRCHHSLEYHDKYCPIKLANVNTKYLRDRRIVLTQMEKEQACMDCCGNIQAEFCIEREICSCPIAEYQYKVKYNLIETVTFKDYENLMKDLRGEY